jgi:hypothetical protein
MQRKALLFAGVRALGRIVRRIIHVLLILVGFLVMLFSAFSTVEPFLAILFFGGLGIAMMIKGFSLDNRLAHRVAGERKENATHRIAEITSAPWDTDRTLVVGSDILIPMVFALSCGIIGVGMIYKWLSGSSWEAIDSYLVFLFAAGSVPMSFWVYHSLGKPACVLDTKGIRTTFFGDIPWNHVSGIALEKIDFLGWKPDALVLNVFPQPRPKWSLRWTRGTMSTIGLSVSGDGKLVVPFKDKRETPETVEAVARHLWNQATGKTPIDPPRHPAGK